MRLRNSMRSGGGARRSRSRSSIVSRVLPRRDLLRLAHMCTLRAFPPGTQLLNERTPGEFLYLVLRGTVSLTLHDRAGHEVLIGVLNRGDCFGEGPLFGDLFRGATVQSETICYLLQLPLAEVRGAMADSPELAARATGDLSPPAGRKYAWPRAAVQPAFAARARRDRRRCSSRSTTRAGATIIHEGEPGDALYLIESGQVVVERDGQLIAHLDEGDFFGEMSLLAEKPHNADIRAVTPAEVLALPAEDFMPAAPRAAGPGRTAPRGRRAAPRRPARRCGATRRVSTSSRRRSRMGCCAAPMCWCATRNSATTAATSARMPARRATARRAFTPAACCSMGWM